MTAVWLIFLVSVSLYANSGLSAVGSDFVLVEHLTFDEGAGVDVIDSSEYGNGGTMMNGVSWVIPGRFGNAVRFDGTNDFVNVSDAPSLDIVGKIRIEVWINPDVNDQLMNIIAKWAPSNYSYALNMGVLLNPSYPEHGNPGTHPGKIGFFWAPDGTQATRQFLASSSVVSANSWTNVTVTYDGSLVRLYINGNLDNSTAYSGSLFAGNSELRIGASADTSPFFFDGVIDEFKIHRTFPTYDATIRAYCNIEGVYVSVPITKDGAFTGFSTPHTFTEYNTHRFTVPNVDGNGHPFYRWSTGETSTTLILSSGGTFTAFYGVPLILESDIAVIDVSTSRTLVHQTYSTVDVYVQVKNTGAIDETFNVTAYRNSTVIGTQTVIGLTPDENRTLTFTWNTTGVPFGNFIMSANATAVPDEIDLSNNSLTDGVVRVTIPGDVNGDKVIDMLDISTVSAHWYPGPPVGPSSYDVNVDINGNGTIDIIEVSIVSAHWGQSW